MAVTAWTDNDMYGKPMDWENPDPNDGNYWEALTKAFLERWVVYFSVGWLGLSSTKWDTFVFDWKGQGMKGDFFSFSEIRSISSAYINHSLVENIEGFENQPYIPEYDPGVYSDSSLTPNGIFQVAGYDGSFPLLHSLKNGYSAYYSGDGDRKEVVRKNMALAYKCFNLMRWVDVARLSITYSVDPKEGLAKRYCGRSDNEVDSEGNITHYGSFAEAVSNLEPYSLDFTCAPGFGFGEAVAYGWQGDTVYASYSVEKRNTVIKFIKGNSYKGFEGGDQDIPVKIFGGLYRDYSPSAWYTAPGQRAFYCEEYPNVRAAGSEFLRTPAPSVWPYTPEYGRGNPGGNQTYYAFLGDFIVPAGVKNSWFVGKENLTGTIGPNPASNPDFDASYYKGEENRRAYGWSLTGKMTSSKHHSTRLKAITDMSPYFKFKDY